MEIEQFLNKLPDAYSRTDREMLEKAYRFAEKAHQGQTRANGQPYFSHPLGVANILIDMDAIAEIDHLSRPDPTSRSLWIPRYFSAFNIVECYSADPAAGGCFHICDGGSF